MLNPWQCNADAERPPAPVLGRSKPASGLRPLAALGMPPRLQARFLRLIERNAGMVLVTGPTGGGKTTTLYSALDLLNEPDTTIITVEDPVEHQLDRVTQVQVEPQIGLDFGRILRSVLRHDPDVILIGEMRDRETLDLGLRAAVTGRLVFSTLHTMTAVAGIERLVDLGAPGYLVAAAVRGVLAQRLLRRICVDCAEPHAPDAHEFAWAAAQIGATAAAALALQAGAGCHYCKLTGYRGRVAVYELLEIDGGQADAIRRGDFAGFSRRARAQPEDLPLIRAAFALAARGLTSLAEVMRSFGGLAAEPTALAAAARESAGDHELPPERVPSWSG